MASTILPPANPRIPSILVLILLLGFAARLAVILPSHSQGYGSDEKEYRFLGNQLVNGNGFVDSNNLRSIKAPLFPAILAVCSEIAGSSLLLPFFLVTLLGSLTILAGYFLALEYWKDSAIALFAAGLIAFCPPLVLYGSLLMSENLFIPLFLFSLFLIVRLEHDQRYSLHILFGVAAGLATLTRAIFVGLVPVLLLIVAIHRWQARKSPARLLVAFAVWLVVLLPWTLRNYRVHQSIVPISTFAGRSLLIGNNPFSNGTLRLASGFQEWERMKIRERGFSSLDSLSEIQLVTNEREIALEYMISHPGRTLTLAARKVYIFWFYPLSHQSSNHPLQASMMLGDILLWLGVLGAIIVVHVRRIRFPLLGTIFVFFTLVHGLLHAEARYRLPLVPLLCIIAAGTVHARHSSERQKIFADADSRLILYAGVTLIFLAYGAAGMILMSGVD